MPTIQNHSSLYIQLIYVYFTSHHAQYTYVILLLEVIDLPPN
jgi:hypothetical protein